MEMCYRYMTHPELPNCKCFWHPDVTKPEPCFPVLLMGPMHEGCTPSLKEEKKVQLLNIADPVSPASCTPVPESRLAWHD